MKRVFSCALFVSLVFTFAGSAHGQCSTPTINSFSISPNVIRGDESELATATVSACLPPGATNLNLSIQPSYFNATEFICSGGSKVSGGCNYYGVGPGNVTVTFQTNGANYTTNDVQGQILVTPSSPSSATVSLTVTGVGGNGPGTDGPCPICGVGSPINLTNGNTWITQRDYSLPGLAGGLTLTRTWNSYWSNVNPPEESGIFGDSWRSNFEERIQSFPSYVVYWKGDGSWMAYNYDLFSQVYTLVAPSDEQTTLTVDSNTNVWTIAEKDGTQKTFNQAGYLTSIVDRNGNTTTINVDASNQNRISSVVDPAGRVLTFNYNNPSYPRLCTSISDSMGTFTQYQYDSAGRLIQVLYPDGSQYNFQYNDPNSNTLISLVTDEQGKTIEAHTYDSQRRGATTQQANDSNGRPVNYVQVHYGSPQAWNATIFDSMGSSTTVNISTRNQRLYLSSTSAAGGAVACNSCGFPGISKATFDEFGYRTSDVDGNGHTIYYSYDRYGNMLSKSMQDFYTSEWDTWAYTYNSFGEVLTATDPLGAPGDPNHTTVNTYDANGNLLTITTPSPDGTTLGSVTTFTYNTNGTLSTITDPLQNVTTLTYYSSGLIHTITDTASNVTTYAYDGRGNRTSVTDAASNLTQFQYDAMNRLTEIIYPDSSTVQYGYDYRGRRTSVTDQNGKVTSYAYDDADRLISVTDAQTPTPGVTTYAYDTENDLTDIWDAKGNHTQFSYFPGKYLYRTTFPSGLTESYSWDDNNNLTSKTDRKGNYIAYNYDYQNHLYLKEYISTGYTAYYYYDQAGRLTQVADYNSGSTGTYGFAYDNMNRLASTTTAYNFLSTGPYTVQYGYDAASNRVSLTDPQGTQTTYGYDNLNRLSSLSNSWAGSFGFSYDNLSRRTQLTRPNGVTTTYNYDNLSHLLSVLHQAGGTTLDGASYTYDAAGNRLSKTDLQANVTSNYTYDAIYQLLQVTQGTSDFATLIWPQFGRLIWPHLIYSDQPTLFWPARTGRQWIGDRRWNCLNRSGGSIGLA